MITNVAIVSIFCSDLDETRDFYVDVLGFDAAEDVSFGDYRWVTVTHPSQPELFLHITTPGPPLDDQLVEAIRRSLAAGMMTGIGLRVDDCRATYAELSAKGVTFLQEPAERPYGVEAVMRDNAGNWLVLVEQHDYTPEDFEGFTFDDAPAAG
jgi:catechol 2,3-dioxygenase-like lactoylglutathione lyase family enzyme